MNTPVPPRPCDLFLQERGHLLGDHGFIADPGRAEYTAEGNIVFYHYTYRRHLDAILAPGSGLWARLPVVHCDVAPEFVDCHLVEGLLEPLPTWLWQSPYFGDLGLEMMHTYVGDTLLRIEVPASLPGLYVADAAHNFECKHQERRGHSTLGLSYNCQTGEEVCRAEIYSYMPLQQYQGGHVAPNVKVVRQGEGIAIPQRWISLPPTQPLWKE